MIAVLFVPRSDSRVKNNSRFTTGGAAKVCTSYWFIATCLLTKFMCIIRISGETMHVLLGSPSAFDRLKTPASSQHIYKGNASPNAYILLLIEKLISQRRVAVVMLSRVFVLPIDGSSVLDSFCLGIK